MICKIQLFLIAICKKSDFRGSNGFNINLLENKVKGAKFSCLEAINLLYPFGIIID